MFSKHTFFIKSICLFLFVALFNQVIPRESVISFDNQKGRASYYASKFNGRRTASGETYRDHQYTCAHKTLPFGTLLKVTNLDNNQTVIVKVTDRGPFVKGRLVDLSRIAAKEIGMVQAGTAYVQVELACPESYDPITNTYEPSASHRLIEKYHFE